MGGAQHGLDPLVFAHSRPRLRYQKNIMGMWIVNRLRDELCPDRTFPRSNSPVWAFTSPVVVALVYSLAFTPVSFHSRY